MKININYDYGISNIVCPSCEGDNLHHDRVEAYWRDKEDGDTRLDISSKTEIDTRQQCQQNNIDNPSERRSAVLIWFWCETCDADIWVSIAQNKGLTHIETGYIEHGRESEKRTNKLSE